MESAKRNRRAKGLVTAILISLVCCIQTTHAQNKALLFDGATNKVVIENHSDFDFTTQFTLEAWIYANNWKDQAWQGSIISKDADSGGASRGYVLRAGADGRLDGIITPGWQGTITGPLMKENKWNHVAMVFNKGEMWLYINGSQQAYAAGLPDTINISPMNLQLGESPGFPGRVWDGMMDEVRIWDTARTALEIQQNMALPLNGTEEGLVAYYNFNEDDASDTLTDLTGNGHVGTLVNYSSGATWTSGYELSQNDIAVTAIVSPGDNPAWSMSERVKVEITNTAFNRISDFDLSFEYNGQVYTETVTDTIEPWGSYVHSFKKFLDLRAEEEVTITAYVSWEDDTDPDNNSMEGTFVRSNTIRLMDRVQHNFSDKGQLHNNIVVLPDDNAKYSQLLLHISVDCPATGCDAWDQAGNVKITKDGKDYEIGRFITPYGKACGPWTIDVSDFRSVLTGTVDVKSYIEVWGPSGWLLTLDLTYIEGDLETPYTQVMPLYEIDRQVYGDPDISYDLPEESVFIPSNTQISHIRMTTTGHGQANTNNAAEFMEANHHMFVNGVDMFTHHLWKDDCDQNTCSPQSGTWQYARAGWCPGQQVNPVWFNITGELALGEEMTFDYVLQEYTNLLNSGYNGGSHTEPFYKIYSYLYLASDSPFEDFTDLAVDTVYLSEGATEGDNNLTMKLVNKGSVDIIDVTVGYVINNTQAASDTMSLNLSPGADTTFEIELASFDATQPGIVFGYVDVASDKILSNNAKAVGYGGYTKFNEMPAPAQLDVYPNPATEVLRISGLSKLTRAQIIDLSGKKVFEGLVIDEIDLSEMNAGFYILKIKDSKPIKFFKN